MDGPEQRITRQDPSEYLMSIGMPSRTGLRIRRRMSLRFAPGSHIKQYRIGELLGRGGMGEVYAAEDTRLGRRVAIKLLPSAFGGDQERLRRFMLEARAASALNHPSILTIHDIDDVDGTPLLVSELVEGVTLRERLRSGGLTLNDSLDIAGQIASALAAAHNAGIVHRDVKPENIMLREDGLAKLLDFGLAKLALDTDSPGSSADTQTALAHTTPGVVMGTTRYLSPEQARGLPVDGRSDIFSLGAVLYEMVTARPAFEGQTPTDVILAVLQHPVEPIEGAPPEVDRILQKALDKERGERYQTAKDLAVDLRRLRKQRDGLVDPVLSSTPVKGGASWRTPRSGASIPASIAVTAPPARRRWWIWGGVAGAAAIAGLISLGGGRVDFWRNLAPSTSSPAVVGGTTVERLSGLGDLSSVAISDDEKYLVYTTRSGGHTTMWLRQMATGSAVKIAEPSDRSIEYPQFTPDGNFLFYSESASALTKPSLNAIPLFGGTPRRILEGRWGRVSFSPDGKRFVAVRSTDVDDTLMIFNTDGTDGRSLGVRRYPEYYGSPAWSPSGDSIAVVLAGTVREGQVRFEIQIVPVAGGSPRMLARTGTTISYLLSLSWSTDDTTLVVTGMLLTSTATFQIWSVRVSDGLVRPVTQDTNDYQRLSVARRSGTVVALKTERFGSTWIGPLDRLDAAKEMASTLSEQHGGRGITWVTDDTLALTRVTDLPRLWLSRLDGTGARPLTEGVSTVPVRSADGRSLFFAGNLRLSPDSPAVFAVPVAGGPVRELTLEASYPAAVTPDGKGLLYFTAMTTKSQLKLMPLDGGPVRTLSEALEFAYARISTDGKWLAVGSYEGSNYESKKTLMPLAGGTPRRLALPSDTTIEAWFPDGKGLLVSKMDNGVGNLWRWDIATATLRQLTHFTTLSLSGAAISPDGKRVAFFRGFTERQAVLLKKTENK